MTYIITFLNGVTLTRSSDRTYTHAWAVFDRHDKLVTRFAGMRGFAADRGKAQRAAEGALRRAGEHGSYIQVGECKVVA